MLNRSRAFKLSLVVGLAILVTFFSTDILREKEGSPVSGLYGGEAMALTSGMFRVSVETDYLLFCTPVMTSASTEALDGIVGFVIFVSVRDLLSPGPRDTEMDTRVAYTPHTITNTHLAERGLILGTDEPLSTSSGIPVFASAKFADLPSHENTDHVNTATIQLTVTSTTGIAETRAFNVITTLPSCAP